MHFRKTLTEGRDSITHDSKEYFFFANENFKSRRCTKDLNRQIVLKMQLNHNFQIPNRLRLLIRIIYNIKYGNRNDRFPSNN